MCEIFYSTAKNLAREKRQNFAQLPWTRRHSESRNFETAQHIDKQKPYRLGAVASLKSLAIENMTPHFWPMSILVKRLDGMNQDTTWYAAGIRLGTVDIVLDGDPLLPQKGAQQPHFSVHCSGWHPRTPAFYQ